MCMQAGRGPRQPPAHRLPNHSGALPRGPGFLGRGGAPRGRRAKRGTLTVNPQKVARARPGGAGTTAAGLRAGCPTTVVPFFGDQAFWGEAVRRVGVGPKPIPIDSFSKDKLVRALKFMAKPQVGVPCRQGLGVLVRIVLNLGCWCCALTRVKALVNQGGNQGTGTIESQRGRCSVILHAGDPYRRKPRSSRQPCLKLGAAFEEPGIGPSCVRCACTSL